MNFTTKKFAAIDIGSNAIRLLISSVNTYGDLPPVFKKISLIRVPIRLGEDVFLTGSISQKNIERMAQAMQAYQLLMATHNIVAYKACATSAMREAQNGLEVAKVIKNSTDIDIEIIDGDLEASIIAATDLHDMLDPRKVYLYVDVGGGSTEFTIYDQAEKTLSRSFKIGTVRLLHNKVDKTEWEEVQRWITQNTAHYDIISVIGSGGNINSIYKNSNKTSGKPLSYFYLSRYYRQLKQYSYEERMYYMNLNTDRADVIIPACEIYMNSMKWSGANHIYVPKIGLSDGIIKLLYQENTGSNPPQI